MCVSVCQKETLNRAEKGGVASVAVSNSESNVNTFCSEFWNVAFSNILSSTKVLGNQRSVKHCASFQYCSTQQYIIIPGILLQNFMDFSRDLIFAVYTVFHCRCAAQCAVQYKVSTAAAAGSSIMHSSSNLLTGEILINSYLLLPIRYTSRVTILSGFEGCSCSVEVL
jgi:hypothetical protein